MTWNHRVFKCKNEYEEWLEIREVFYNQDGKIYAYTEQAIKVTAENAEDFRQTLEWMLRALDQPLLVDGEVELAEEGDDETPSA